jgi:2-polyprenyl-3-methyl-5-hydroxy-6-metoxy-1,4-benzoquinol methylase
MGDSLSNNADPRTMDERSFQEWNEQMARVGNPDDFHKKSTGLVRWINQKRVKYVLRFLEAGQHDKVLEVGCGAGNILAQIDSTDRTGVDLSENLLRLSRQNCGPGACLRKANAEHLPFPATTFDRVYCTEVLEHIQHPERAVAEIARVLKPGGRAVFSLPNDHAINFAKRILKGAGLFKLLLGSRKKNHFQPLDENAWHIHALTLKELRTFCTGFFREVRKVFIPTRFFPVQVVVAFERTAAGMTGREAA